ncbi:hypothetical protein [Bacillus litorisediminis]|uniref:hypothetical protein n=1 Tax=Bacillus litorisediminis TaxID=2922713 RepID=UPI001FAE902F|nr:hypothetical protein [Bacillus litorisediminis]
MEILIKLKLSINDNRTALGGHFRVNYRNFKEDPNKEAARIAYKWILKINFEHGYTAKILNVTWNEENDITELVRKIDEAPFR